MNEANDMEKRVQSSESKHINLRIDHTDKLYNVAKALASVQRIEILKMLATHGMYVNEIAHKLDIPVSTASHNVRILENAGIIMCEQRPGIRGTMKLCHRQLDSVGISLIPQVQSRDSTLTISQPVGCYSFADDIASTCGLASEHASIGEEDNPRSFFIPDRTNASIIWFRHGYLTYHFAVLSMKNIDVQWLEISFEACSEAPMYRDSWKSDIDLFVNDKHVGSWTSPSDCGGRRGLLNPQWWSDMSTQYGSLKTWRIDSTGSYLENMHASNITITDLELDKNYYIAVKIGVSKDAEHIGGINLFGKGFGDFPQDIVMRVGYTMK